MNQPEIHRQRIEDIFSSDALHQHQIDAANKTYSAFNNDVRAVVTAAEMQAGKSGIALALCCFQRMSLSDKDICVRKQLKDTLYLVTMPDTALRDQAEGDLELAKNVVVSNFVNFEKALELSSEAEEQHDESLLLEAKQAANDALKNSILRRDFSTRLVFHKTSDEYYGVREMLSNGKVTNLDDNCRNFLIDSEERQQFINEFKSHQGMGWSLVRVPAGNAMDAKEYFISQGIDEHNIFILGNSLSGVPEDELSTIHRFKKDFDDAHLFGDKLVAITVAGCRAGINFGAMMKNNLISTWDSTVASVAAVVQANVGRACGYHDNNSSSHYTNINAAEAYGAILDYLERTCSTHAASDFDGIKEFFEDVCQEYHVNGLDVGLTIKYKRRRPIGDVETYGTDSYIVVPANLLQHDADFSEYTKDKYFLQAISILREEFTKNGAPSVKGNRAMRGKKKNWIKAQWVNGDSYDNPEKAGVDGPQQERTIMLTNMINNKDFVEFNRVVAPGSGELTENKLINATVFSIYNISRRKVIKTMMTKHDVWDMCDHFNVPHDDTLFVLYKRGEYDVERTIAKKEHNKLPEKTGDLQDESQFSANQTL